MNKHDVIRELRLEPHIEGGYFRRTFAASRNTDATPASRPLMSSIFYLLTDDQPLGHLHRNRSDILHYWHAGSALRYWLIKPDGELQQVVLGPDLSNAEQLQLLVPGGWWKATELLNGDFGLLSEAVCPGFDFADMTLGAYEEMVALFPQHALLLQRLCRH